MGAERKYPVYTVTTLTREIIAQLKGLGEVILSGEVSGTRKYPSGHLYFTLKDAEAQIACVMFASDLNRVTARLGEVIKDGAQVELFGSVGVYPTRGNYQFVARSVRLTGAGELMRRYLELKAKLEAEGLFAPERKRPLPRYPRRIAIVTSEAGAVIHDLCTVLVRRWPALEIRLYPARVQGAEAPAELIAGLEYFNAPGDWRADVLILARGGGSFEDLFCFNDEQLVRTLAASRIPTISAVGHETDFTLCDFAADVRAGTPSMAAETAVPVQADVERHLADLLGALALALRSRGEWYDQRLDHLADTLSLVLEGSASRAERRLALAAGALVPAVRLAFERAGARLASVAGRLQPVTQVALTQATARCEAARQALALLSPYGVLERGYALVTDAGGAVVKRSDALAPGTPVAVRLGAGAFDATVTGVRQ